MKFFGILSVCSLAALWLAGCADPAPMSSRYSVRATPSVETQQNPNRVTQSRASVEDRPFRMPGNFSTHSWKRMVIGVNPRTNVYSSSSSFFGEDDVRYMGSRLQSELAKLKRFTVQDIEDADYTAVMNLADMGEISLAERAGQPTITHIAQWNAKLSTTSRRVDAYEKEIIVTCSITFKLTDVATRNIVEDTSFDVKVFLHQQMDRMGRVVSGINWRDEGSLRGIAQDLASEASIRIANILGNESPCGGKIVACLGMKAMVMENGTNQGVTDGMQMLVYANIEGVPVPLAYADAQPGADRTKLDLWKFNEDDPFAETVIDAITANRASYKEYDLNAVAVGEADEPEWRARVLTVEPEW